MSNPDDLRALQQRFLEHGATCWQIGYHGWDGKIAGPESPSFANVRDRVLPGWETWFREFLGETPCRVGSESSSPCPQ